MISAHLLILFFSGYNRSSMLLFLRKWESLAVLSLALAIIIIDSTILNVSLGTIIREFHTDIQSLQWVITAYALVLAALTITGGRLGDLLGRKRMFMTGAILFAIGSFITAVSTSIPVMLLGESLIEGIGAAIMLPATASLIVANYQGHDRAVAFGFWGGIAGAASAIGPLLGGYLTTTYSWRWGFLINVFIVVILLLGSILIKESRDTEEKPTLDWTGVFLSAIGLLGIVFGIIESSQYGWWVVKDHFVIFNKMIEPFGLSLVPFSITIGILFLIAFFLWEQHMEKQKKTPLVSLSIFRNITFTAGVLTITIISFEQIGMIFALPVFLQSVLRLNAFQTGLALLPFSLAFLIAAPLAGIFSNKFPPKYIILSGLFFNVLGLFLLRMSISQTDNILSLSPAMLVMGIGMGMVMAQISNMTLSAVSIQQVGEASGVNNTMRQVGSSLGAAIIGAALLSSLGVNISAGIEKSMIIPSAAKQQIAHMVSQQTSSIEFGSGLHVGNNTSPYIVSEIKKITNDATVIATKESLFYAILVACLGFLTGMLLPNTKPHLQKPEKQQATTE